MITKRPFVFALGLVLLLTGVRSSTAEGFKGSQQVILHEMAWMGTRLSADQQWFELYNPGSNAVDLAGWHLRSRDGDFNVPLSGVLAPGDSVVWLKAGQPPLPGVKSAGHFEDPLPAKRPRLLLEDARGKLVDMVDHWHAGDARKRATMQRVSPYRAGYTSKGWTTSTVRYDLGFGTPGFRGSTGPRAEQLHQVVHGPGAINVYFNSPAYTEAASAGNIANHLVNLEQRLLDRMRHVTNRIDMTIYEINLQGLADMLIRKAAEGVQVRVVLDAKEPTDPERIERYEEMRLYLELLARGLDGKIGTADDIMMIATSPIFTFEDPARRKALGLRAIPTDIPKVTVQIGNNQVEGRLLVDAERKADGTYYRPGAQMHNKFVLLDQRWVWTGSMNFTVTDLYGSEAQRDAGLLEGNSNDALELHSPELAAIYQEEFEQMWGGTGPRPDFKAALFSSRKKSGQDPHHIKVGARAVDVYFSPGYNVIPAITDYVRKNAREKLYFSIFAWSDYDLERVVKMKWETSEGYRKGKLTGFDLRGIFEFWREWWSAAANMTGRTVKRASVNNPNVRWKYSPPVFPQNEVRRLHHKYMIIDADTKYDPTVITGSANWSNNANAINDENTLFIHSDRIANQYLQDFFGQYQRAGGKVD